jgi:hypothetical protein
MQETAPRAATASRLLGSVSEADLHLRARARGEVAFSVLYHSGIGARAFIPPFDSFRPRQPRGDLCILEAPQEKSCMH